MGFVFVDNDIWEFPNSLPLGAIICLIYKVEKVPVYLDLLGCFMINGNSENPMVLRVDI